MPSILRAIKAAAAAAQIIARRTTQVTITPAAPPMHPPPTAPTSLADIILSIVETEIRTQIDLGAILWIYRQLGLAVLRAANALQWSAGLVVDNSGIGRLSARPSQDEIAATADTLSTDLWQMRWTRAQLLDPNQRDQIRSGLQTAIDRIADQLRRARSTPGMPQDLIDYLLRKLDFLKYVYNYLISNYQQRIAELHTAIAQAELACRAIAAFAAQQRWDAIRAQAIAMVGVIGIRPAGLLVPWPGSRAAIFSEMSVNWQTLLRMWRGAPPNTINEIWYWGRATQRLRQYENWVAAMRQRIADAEAAHAAAGTTPNWQDIIEEALDATAVEMRLGEAIRTAEYTGVYPR